MSRRQACSYTPGVAQLEKFLVFHVLQLTCPQRTSIEQKDPEPHIEEKDPAINSAVLKNKSILQYFIVLYLALVYSSGQPLKVPFFLGRRY